MPKSVNPEAVWQVVKGIVIPDPIRVIKTASQSKAFRSGIDYAIVANANSNMNTSLAIDRFAIATYHFAAPSIPQQSTYIVSSFFQRQEFFSKTGIEAEVCCTVIACLSFGVV